MWTIEQNATTSLNKTGGGLEGYPGHACHFKNILFLCLFSPPALLRFYLKNILFRKHQVIHEGVVQPGKQNLLNNVYVEPQLSHCGYGGVDPSHEILAQFPTSLQVPREDTFVSVNSLFRLQKDDGSPVKTVVTTGIPGVGMSVSVAKFSLDWAELHANRVR